MNPKTLLLKQTNSKIPIIGLGTWLSTKQELQQAV